MNHDVEWSRLFRLIEDARDLLVEAGESHWSDWLAERERTLRAQGMNGLPSLLGGFGGMGSFNDLLVLQINGHSVLPADEELINSRFHDFRSEIFTTAEHLRTNPTE